MSFDNSKYDLELNSVGYRVAMYRKSEASTFIPRLGAGTQSDSEFDLLKSRSIASFAGGGLQRQWKNDDAAFGLENLMTLFDDGVAYPVKMVETMTDIMGKAKVTAWVLSSDYAFLAVQGFSGSIGITRIDKTGAKVFLTLPASLSSGPSYIPSMAIWNNQLWITKHITNSIWYMPLSSTTPIEITGGDGSLRLLAVYQGNLYGTNSGSADYNSAIYKYTGSTSSRGVSMVGATGLLKPSDTANLFLFNGRIHLTRSEGMYAYDGIRLAPVDDTIRNVDDRNFYLPTVLRGHCYYFMADGFYRYNGSMIEKLYDVGEVGFPVSACAGKNRIWLLYKNSAFSGSSRYDKSMGYDYASGNSIDGRIAVFDGKAMFTYSRTTLIDKGGQTDFAGQGENHTIMWFNDRIYAFTNMEFAGPGKYFTQSTNEAANTGTTNWRIVTSIFDADFPMIDKNLENLELVLDGDPAADETVAIEYRTAGFAGSTGWTPLGSFKTQTKLKELVSRVVLGGLTFRKIQFRLSGTTTLGYGIAKFIIRYTLSPDFKWQWDVTLNAFGDSKLEPLLLKDGSADTQSVSLLRGTVYAARASDAPVLFVDMDQLDLAGAHTSGVQTITLNDTALLKPTGYIKIDDELIYYTAKTATTLTGCERGVLGTAAAAHSDNAAVFPAYRVIVRSLKNEIIEPDDSGNDLAENVSLPSQIQLTLQEV